MWKNLMICLVLGVASCSGNKSNEGNNVADAENMNVPVENIQGQWLIENVVENDSSYVRPSEIEPGMTPYIDFRDNNAFRIVTNCNHIEGTYTQTNDSIHLNELMTTEMACDNMELEEMLIKVLPSVNTVDCINDSITRLNTSKGDSYIVLQKASQKVK